MTWTIDEDVFSMLSYLIEAKGSIGALIDLSDERQAGALSENEKRINCAIDTLYDIIKKESKSKLVKSVMEHTKETQ